MNNYPPPITITQLLNDVRNVITILHHFPTKQEYQTYGHHFGTQIYMFHGLSGIAKLLNRPPVTKGKKINNTTVTRETVIDDIRRVKTRLGHFPTRLDYMTEGKYIHTNVFKQLGMQGLAKLLGERTTKNGPRKTVQKEVFYCLNGLDCVKIKKVKGIIHAARVSCKQTYCVPCKRERGWYD